LRTGVAGVVSRTWVVVMTWVVVDCPCVEGVEELHGHF
jgi:hypothetical protein